MLPIDSTLMYQLLQIIGFQLFHQLIQQLNFYFNFKLIVNTLNKYPNEIPIKLHNYKLEKEKNKFHNFNVIKNQNFEIDTLM